MRGEETGFRTPAGFQETLTREELVAELEAMNRLHELSLRLLALTELRPLLEEVLDGAMALQHAEFGQIQLYNPETQSLDVIVQRGLSREFLDHFAAVSDSSSACSRERVIIEDVVTDSRFAPHLESAASAGVRAVQSTPLFAYDSQLLGVITSHFRQPHRPTDRELRVTDLYAHMAADAIARQRSQETLRLSEARFRRYFDLGLIGMALTSPGKGILEVNDELCRILGYERDEVLQKSWAEMTYPADLEADVAQFQRVMAGEIDGYTLDKRWIRKDGRIIHTIMAAKGMRCSDGSVEYFLGLILDVTERKQAEEKLRDSERRFRLLVESIPHHVFGLLHDGIISYCNQRLLNYIPITEQQLRKTGCWEALHPSDLEKIKDRWQQAWEHGTDYEMEERIRGRDNQYRRFLCRAVAVREPGRPVEWFGTHTDVEDLRRTEEALQSAQADLAHVNRVAAMGELTASIAHEINQPLTAILTNANACRRMVAKEIFDLNELKLTVADIGNAAGAAAGVIARVRSLMQKAPIEKIQLRVNDMIEDVLKLTRSQLAKNQIAVQTSLASAAPQVFADRVQLQQVLLNLIINAIEALASVPQPRTLRIASSMNHENMQVTVEDSGPGLDGSKLNKVFETFYTTKKGGMGLGLSIARSIIFAHGGRLWAAAGESGGALFRFTLPAQRTQYA
ncbi:MAG TPA: PAS domain S-box protein [Candidatus Angelobacter sp.]